MSKQRQSEFERDPQQFHHDLNEARTQPLGSVGLALRDSLLARVFKELNPSAWAVGLKLLVVHLFSSALSLSVCEQFGVRLFGQGHGLMALFMHFGVIGCFICCGAFYLGSTLVLSRLCLSYPEWRRLRQDFIPFFAALALGSLVVFWLIQGQLAPILALAWLGGAVATVLATDGLLRRRAV